MKHTLLILLLTALPSLARLGETKADCEARYGKPVRTTASGKPVYLKGGLEIAILFWKDKAAILYIAKPTPGAPDLDNSNWEAEKRASLSQAEMDVLLKASSGTSEWKRQSEEDNPFQDLAWKRSDSKADASYYDKRLILSDTDAEAEMEKETERQEAEKLKDFGGFGETRAQCDKRYGKPIEVDGDQADYKKDGILILVTFWKGKAARLIFIPKPPDSEPEGKGFFLAHERDAILKANGEGSQWKEDEDDEDLNRIAWFRADGKAFALYHSDDDNLIIASEEHTDHQRQQDEKEEAKKLDGF
ncbi:hypothetical protein OKA05_27320 [Luteolibacter arcticus]|uniref:Uncharacterized protein n=1 Tax=Luteolibacter arcticus TaxID=1581411 RepID=A0ABT3GS21_9BACT|nr:hypothetical protein [Luteolibacter arcticus]MCW1926295.1 hypothetical protein [Luteolibacter arcticus]